MLGFFALPPKEEAFTSSHGYSAAQVLVQLTVIFPYNRSIEATAKE